VLRVEEGALHAADGSPGPSGLPKPRPPASTNSIAPSERRAAGSPDPSTPAIEPFDAAAALAAADLERAIEAFNAGWAERFRGWLLEFD
jgi:hypothetical protein